ncbi:MAG: T9SS type A sorting domain-containing protein [candidate division Zixibacteria bacterium]|nr:T9SS type A sorting domain-containing protein [candidate division Zixibacteria bacterium]
MYVILLMILILSTVSIFAQELTIHCVDIGQGDCTVIQSPSGKTMMVDNGSYSQRYSLMSYLNSIEVDHLNWFIATHYHSDHIGCTSYLVQQGIEIDSVYDRGWSYCTPTFETYYEPVVRDFRYTVEDGQIIDFGDGVTCRIVSLNGNGRLNEPFISENCPNSGPNDENDFSVVMVISYGHFDFYVGGDLAGMNTSSYRDIETFIALEVGDVEVYQVNHHGSYSSSNLNFLNIIDPEVSVISLGNNNYGHPHEETVQRLLATSEIYQTEDSDGNVVDGDIVIEVFEEDYYTVNSDTFDIVTSIHDDREASLPGVLAIGNYPNPFNAQTTISYRLPAASRVTLDIYDILGRKIIKLVDCDQSAGSHQVAWDASGVSSGIYFYRIRAGNIAETGQMVFLR